jgi:hypothetical protein
MIKEIIALSFPSIGLLNNLWGFNGVSEQKAGLGLGRTGNGKEKTQEGQET